VNLDLLMYLCQIWFVVISLTSLRTHWNLQHRYWCVLALG